MKRLHLAGFSSKKNLSAEGMKTISSFLSQDGIILEELNLSLKEKKKSHI